MTDDFTELDGVGPAREDKLNDQGYTTYEELAEADYEELADSINRLPEDSALEIVVQSQNMRDLQEVEVEESVEEEEDESVEEEEDESVEEEEDESVEEEFSVEITFESSTEYDTFYHTVIEERCRLHRTNRSGVKSYEKILGAIRESSPNAGITIELTVDELNDLHNAILEQRLDYQGDNVIDYMDALKQVEERINDSREEYIF